MKLWQPANGASLEYVASKRGSPVITVSGVTVALAQNDSLRRR